MRGAHGLEYKVCQDRTDIKEWAYLEICKSFEAHLVWSNMDMEAMMGS